MRELASLLLLLSASIMLAQESNIAYELNGRASNKEIIEGSRESKNPFKAFIGEWTLKGNNWTLNWGNGTETLQIPAHHTTSSQINTEYSLLSIIDGPEPNGHIYWTFDPASEKVSHSSSFGSLRIGRGTGALDAQGNLTLKVHFTDEAEETYRMYTYTWINENEYELKSIQYDKTGKETGLFYSGNFVRLPNRLEAKKAHFKQMLNGIHAQYVAAAKAKNPELIMNYYSDSSLFIPEFHPLIVGKEHIKTYFTNIYARQELISYERKNEDLICFEDRVVEWGTFNVEGRNKDGEEQKLIGKFMNVWGILENGDLQLRSEQWNYDHPIEDRSHLMVNLPGLPLRYKTSAAKNISRELKHELDAYYLLGAKAVIDRDPYGRLHSYEKEGIFLAPHGETAKIGFEELKEYLIGYNAGEVKIDSLDVGLNHVEDYGEYLIKHSYYYVKASGDGWVHEGQGIGTNLMHRNEKGQLRRLWNIGGEQKVPEKQIPAVVEQFEKASVESMLNNQVDLRTMYYGEESYLMGEYQKVLKGKANLKAYYQAFLDRFHLHSYKKQRIELLDMGDWMLETGTFVMELSLTSSSSTKRYEGKYQNLWRITANKEWEVFAEAWNYNHQIEDWGKFTFSELPEFDHHNVEVKNIPLQVLGLNKISETIISKHDNEKWTQLYDKQGMLLYSHSPLYNGKTAIKAHLEEHVKGLPTFDILNIGTFFLVELDDYIIELGNHYVNWSREDSQGISRGKNIRTWKRGKDGTLKIFRQIAMYDLNE
ncbi:MAG: nuclear transport factor 2 family protein [Bacteroidota bacterium]